MFFLNKAPHVLMLAAATPVAMSSTGMDALVAALASSPGLAAAVVITWLNSKERERAEAARREHESILAKQRENHEDLMASRYRHLVENNQGHMERQGEALNAALRTLAEVTDALREHERGHRS